MARWETIAGELPADVVYLSSGATIHTVIDDGVAATPDNQSGRSA